jgi:hypothetical protein
VRARIYRRWPSAKACMGELWLAAAPAILGPDPWVRSAGSFCYTLEDVVRPPGVKVQNETAIPAGIYTLAIDWSNRFQRYMPHVLNVPMFDGIRIHSGNRDVNTEGCPLVGLRGDPRANPDLIYDCHGVFEQFYLRLESDLKLKRDCSLEIINAFQTVQPAQPQASAPAA